MRIKYTSIQGINLYQFVSSANSELLITVEILQTYHEYFGSENCTVGSGCKVTESRSVVQGRTDVGQPPGNI